ncbi:hypothetical protein [Shinella kummerowiae]|uniref:hypothetical protein n=1 Tax=Shinella kummerowiae TaxID=417745 RepID=UPI0021B66143|nr:hypothetical protein [Shinella kummerowiae]MCT7662342.1 hypothetical protein [Shinella kummerowiae]
MKTEVLKDVALSATEAAHVEFVRDWSGRIAEWTIRSAAMREERIVLESQLSLESRRMVGRLVRLGYSPADAEVRIEQLLEQAFRKAPQ